MNTRPDMPQNEGKSGGLMVFEAILTAHERPILNYLIRLVGQREDAEDLTQETFLRLYTNLRRIDTGRNVRGWLYRVATNLAFDALRKRKRLKEAPLEAAEEVPAPASRPADWAEGLDIRRALIRLPHLHQSVLLLYYHDEFSYREIASILNIPLGTLKTHLRNARQELGRALELEAQILPAAAHPKPYGLLFPKN